MTEATARTLTNAEVGDLIGCTHSMASRLRVGKRLPGLDTMRNISERLGVPWTDILNARDAGPDEFGALLRGALARYSAAQRL